MFFDILTLFPSMFEGVLGDSIIKRAACKGIINVHVADIREYASGPRKNVDDYPYGGDPGMLMQPMPLAKAIVAAKQRNASYNPSVIFPCPQGKQLNHSIISELAQNQALIIVCGRYKGIDQRIRDKYIDMEVSIGDYVISGGELAAMVLIDSITRLLPNVLGNKESASKDSFFHGLLGYPHYTRPEEFEGMRVPEVLLNGHHKQIREWQQQQAEHITQKLRPDLWQQYCENNKKEKK